MENFCVETLSKKETGSLRYLIMTSFWKIRLDEILLIAAPFALALVKNYALT